MTSTFALACQEFDIHISYQDANIFLEHNKTKPDMFTDAISLGSQTNSAGENISELISQWINLSVDAAKEPHMSMMGVGMHNLNVVLYLTLAGVNSRTIAALMNQPIILEYYKQRAIDESQIFEENVPYRERNKEARLKNLKLKYSAELTRGKENAIKPIGGEIFSAEDLESMVKPLSKLTDNDRAKQLKLLDDLMHIS